MKERKGYHGLNALFSLIIITCKIIFLPYFNDNGKFISSNSWQENKKWYFLLGKVVSNILENVMSKAKRTDIKKCEKKMA